MQGTLSQLDTRNPVLYIDFPEGRLKFMGTLFFPKNKYMTLRFAQKEVLCEDIFESMVLAQFSSSAPWRIHKNALQAGKALSTMLCM